MYRVLLFSCAKVTAAKNIAAKSVKRSDFIIG
jgi:hypothetical protein